MRIAEIAQLVRWMEEAAIESIEVVSEKRRLRISLDPGARAAPEAAPPSFETLATTEAEATIVKARTPGNFLDRHPSREAPFARVGDAVRCGDIIGLVQTGLVYAPVSAPHDGWLTRIFPASGDIVEFGTPIVAIGAASNGV